MSWVGLQPRSARELNEPEVDGDTFDDRDDIKQGEV